MERHSPQRLLLAHLPNEGKISKRYAGILPKRRSSRCQWWNFDIPQLTLVDNENNPLRHYSVKIDKSSGLHSIIIDFDDNKKKILTTAQLWSESEQLNFLRQSAVSLPEEYTTVKSALSFLANADPFAVEEYHDTLKQKLTDGITAECQQHAGKVTPVVEFMDN